MTSTLARQARHKVGWAIKAGTLVRPDRCDRCGTKDRPMKDGRDGERYYRIASDLNLAPTTVHRIVTHRSWPESARPAPALQTGGER